MASKKNIIPYLAAVAGPALITALALPVRDQLGNAATIALVQIFVVVLVAIRWGSGPALVAAVSAMIIFNFFFLEPYYTFVISGYDDIVFYLAFVAISLAVGNLSAQAKRRADLAESRLGEIERLYADLQQESRERARVEEEVRRLNEELQEKIVQLQEAQEELVRKEKLSILGQLSGSVGHELRNPLGIMSNAVYFLRMVLADADETTREYLGIIENEIANSQRIITDLLDFARTKPPQRQRIAPVALVRQSLPRCTIPRNVMLHVEVPEELPKLHVDPLQLGEVLMNLITNAVQAMPEGGDLTITGEAVDTMLRLAVRDSGTGITPEHMAKLFQPLFTTKPRGIGLGLVVCKNLVGANGGRIEVASEVGQGTTFSVVLPAEGP